MAASLFTAPGVRDRRLLIGALVIATLGVGGALLTRSDDGPGNRSSAVERPRRCFATRPQPAPAPAPTPTARPALRATDPCTAALAAWADARRAPTDDAGYRRLRERAIAACLAR
jgi:hypothetical protein